MQKQGPTELHNSGADIIICTLENANTNCHKGEIA